MFEKWTEVLDNSGGCSFLSIDLSKAFDCIVHDLLQVKLSYVVLIIIYEN